MVLVIVCSFKIVLLIVFTTTEAVVIQAEMPGKILYRAKIALIA